MSPNHYCLLDNHSLLWGSGMLTLNHYEIGIVARLVMGKFVPVEGGPYAREFVQRLQDAHIEPTELLRAIIEQGLHVPDFEVFDDSCMAQSLRMQYITEAILLQHYDRWRRQDGLTP